MARSCKRDNVGTRGKDPTATDEGVMSVLTKDILFGMNILTLAGFVVMGLTLTLNRMG